MVIIILRSHLAPIELLQVLIEIVFRLLYASDFSQCEDRYTKKGRQQISNILLNSKIEKVKLPTSMFYQSWMVSDKEKLILQLYTYRLSKFNLILCRHSAVIFILGIYEK